MNKTLILGALALGLATLAPASQADDKRQWHGHQITPAHHSPHPQPTHRPVPSHKPKPVHHPRPVPARKRQAQLRHEHRTQVRNDRIHDRSLNRMAERVGIILQRDAIVGRYHLRASANGNYITVSGRVHTAAERDRALGLARLSADGSTVRSAISVHR